MTFRGLARSLTLIGLGAGIWLTPVAARAGFPVPLQFNEIRVDQVGVDTDEFIELYGPPGTPINHAIVVVGDGPGGSGTVEAAFFLFGGTIGPSGYYVIAEAGFSGTADVVQNLDLGDSDNLTFLLVDFYKFGVGDDLDSNDDGILEAAGGWGQVFDQVALVETDNPPAAMGDEWHYGPPMGCVASPTCGLAGPTGGPAPMHIQRCGDGTGTWAYTQDDLVADTPGMANACACGDGISVTPPEACDDGGRTAACNADCSVAACGDGAINAPAGEECDDEGESASCDIDCTAVECGDGVANATAGEQCDDGGRSETCDIDCTPAECGDGVVNPVAGEECDDDGVDCVDCIVIKGGTGGGGDSTGAPPSGDSTGAAADTTGGTPVGTSGDTTDGVTTLTAGGDDEAIESCGTCRGGRGGTGPFAWLLGLLALGRRRRTGG